MNERDSEPDRDASEKDRDSEPDRGASGKDRDSEPGGDSTGTDLWITLAGGAVVASVLFLVVLFVGEAGSSEARILLESAFPTIRFLSSSILTLGATVLALMLTLLGFTQSQDLRFSRIHYLRIRKISVMNVVAIISSVCLLLFMKVPLEESETLRSMYEVIYYAFLAVSSMLGGLATAIVLMLHRTIVGLTTAVAPGERTSHLIRDAD